jgi:peptidoglycan/LPS O-acetylase OafA/YrhL
MNKNLEIQTLRAYAIIITIIAHLGYLIPLLNPYLSYYWLGGGVDLFFCISGYVIASNLFKIEMNKNNLIIFFVKRITRLWPAAIFWLLFVLLCSIFFNKSNYFGTFSGNLNLVSCAYFNFTECSLAPALRVYWSLSLEEQFYIIFPILLLILGKKRIALFAIILVLIQIFLYRPWPSPLWFFRTDAICLGVLIAYIHNKYIFDLDIFLFNKYLKIVISLILCILLVIVAKKEIVWFYNGLVVIISGMLVFLASFNRGYFISNNILIEILSFIGERSYSLYLTHMAGIFFTREILFRFFHITSSISNEFIYMFVFIIVTAIFTEFSYRFIEQPMRNRGRTFALVNFKKDNFEKKIN